MPTRVLLTIDTELTWHPHARGASWQENFALSYAPAGVGVPFQLERLATHGLKACFFVDPMPALVYGLEPIRRMVGPILEAGQEVQLHLHPCWKSVADGKAKGADFELTGFAAEEQRALIGTARDLLIAAGAPDPIAFRSGSYAVNEDSIAALRTLGIAYDSSHNGSHHPWPSALPLHPARIGAADLDGVTEVPVTQIEDRRGRLRHLQLCAVSFEELRSALVHAAREEHPVVTLISHSFELATRDGLRPNLTLRRRFERLCAFLAEQRDTLPTAHFTDLGTLPSADPRPLAPSRPRRMRRMAEQLWANAVYERVL
jgi:hypothetical protein